MPSEIPEPIVVYEDERLIAVSKPAGQVVVPGRGEVGEPLNAQLARLRGGRVFVVHRLDREASGLVLFAKDAAAHRLLCSRFEAREVQKTYLALVPGRVEEGGVVESPIRVFGSGRMGVGAGGKPSLTRYRVRERLPEATFLEVEPLTGRRHQIRVHLYSLGHPIIGDTLYGQSRSSPGAARLMLHAWQLSIPGASPLRLKAEPGGDFIRILKDFGGNSNFL